MPACRRCGHVFGDRVKINGVTKIVNTRKFCLDCSPYGAHNTSPTLGAPLDENRPRRCKCGETRPEKFYGRKRYFCASCHCQYTLRTRDQKRTYIIARLGGKCAWCGFDKYRSCLDVHHVDPSMKDPKSRQMAQWSYKKIDKELEGCILLCKICHTAHHNGELKEPQTEISSVW